MLPMPVNGHYLPPSIEQKLLALMSATHQTLFLKQICNPFLEKIKDPRKAQALCWDQLLLSHLLHRERCSDDNHYILSNYRQYTVSMCVWGSNLISWYWDYYARYNSTACASNYIHVWSLCPHYIQPRLVLAMYKQDNRNS